MGPESALQLILAVYGMVQCPSGSCRLDFNADAN